MSQGKTSARLGVALAAIAVLAGAAVSAPVLSPADPVDPVDGLSVRQLAGERFACGFSGHKVPKSLKTRIRKGEIAGVIVFSDNISSRKQLRTLTAKLQHIKRPAGLRMPLLVMADQEGGEVRRVPGPPMASAESMGHMGKKKVKKLGVATGRSLRKAGVNVDLAPVLDVARKGGFISDQHRGFGSKAGVVGVKGTAFAQGLQAAGVAATGKHFPGLGSTSANTDLTTARIGLSKSVLRKVDEKPYERFIASHGDLVMISSAIYPHLDRKLPASQSRKIANGELRTRLGFEGVSVTDALEVPGVTRLAGAAKTAYRVANAGTDLLLYSSCNATKTPARTLRSGLNSGKLKRARFENSVRRVLNLRASL